MQFLQELNERQRRAVEAGNGPMLIVAGPGTGKTKTLTARIAHLLESEQAKPTEILALTFTNKAAREMKKRLSELLDENAKLPKVTTFHALGRGLLQQNGYARELLTEAQRTEIIRSLTKPAAFKNITTRELSLLISRAKTSLTPPADEPTKQFLARYEQALAEQGLQDFDDLLSKTFHLLKTDESKPPSCTHLLIDEFQDTSELQYEILKLLTSSQNIFAIGDPNQSIYAFRGAGAEMFDRFRQDFPNFQQVELTHNYRSCPEVINLANTIFPDSPQLEITTHEPGEIRTVQTLNEYSEAAYIIEEIEKGIGGSDMLKASGDKMVQQPRDYAVLYRTHRAAKALQKAFADSGIPYQIAGEGSPYERPDIQTLIAELRIIENPHDLPVSELATEVAQRLGLHTDNLTQFLGMLVQFGSNIETCLTHIDEISEQEFYDPTVNAVTLLTIHAAKGLEFEHIFLVAAEEGILPKASRKEEANLDEERRLFYVAVTRARRQLDILYTKTRASESSKPSRFTEDMPESLLPRATDPNLVSLEKRLRKRQQKRSQTSLF